MISTVESIRGVKGISHLIVNGGSCAKTAAFLKSYDGVSITESDRGIADGFNKGVLGAKTNYVAFLNSGDVLSDKTYFEKALEILNSNSNIDFVHSDLKLNHSQYGALTLKPKGRLPYMPFNHPLFVARKSCFERVGLFSLDYKVSMDFDWMVRVLKANLKGTYLPLLAVEMDGNGISSTQELKGLKERERSISTHITGIHRAMYLMKIKEFRFKLEIKNQLNKFGLKDIVQRLVK